MFCTGMEGYMQQNFGLNLRRLREGRGVNQEDFAETLGVHRTYLGSVERGERNLSLRRVEEFAAMLGADPLALLAPPER